MHMHMDLDVYMYSMNVYVCIYMYVHVLICMCIQLYILGTTVTPHSHKAGHLPQSTNLGHGHKEAFSEARHR